MIGRVVTPAQEERFRSLLAAGEPLTPEDTRDLVATLDARTALLEGHLVEADESLDGRLNSDWDDLDDPEQARANRIRRACEEYVAAEDVLPDTYDSDDYRFSEAVGWEVRRADEAEAQMGQLDADLTEERKRTWEAWQTASGLERVSHVLGAALLMLPVEMMKRANAGGDMTAGPIFTATMAFMSLSEATRTDAHKDPVWCSLVNERLVDLDRAAKAQLEALQAEERAAR